MERRALSQKELEKRMEVINAREPVTLDAEEETSLAEAEAMDDGTSMTLDEYTKSRAYSGKMLLRIPKELHKELAQAAAENGVSLNQYALYKLSR